MKRSMCGSYHSVASIASIAWIARMTQPEEASFQSRLNFLGVVDVSELAHDPS